MVDVSYFFNKNYVYAVVGASNNIEKYGYKIVKALVDANFKVVPINPKEKEILGLKVYTSLADVPFAVDVVDFVVPPGVTFAVLEDAFKLGVGKVWFQPGSYDAKCELYCRKNKIKVLKDFCLYKKALESLNSDNI